MKTVRIVPQILPHFRIVRKKRHIIKWNIEIRPRPENQGKQYGQFGRYRDVHQGLQPRRDERQRINLSNVRPHRVSRKQFPAPTDAHQCEAFGPGLFQDIPDSGIDVIEELLGRGGIAPVRRCRPVSAARYLKNLASGTCERLGGKDALTKAAERPKAVTRVAEIKGAPGEAWQVRAADFVAECKAALLDDVGAKALAIDSHRGRCVLQCHQASGPILWQEVRRHPRAASIGAGGLEVGI